jgi:hypothetical protein
MSFFSKTARLATRSLRAMITHINTVSVYVDDQNRAAQVWTQNVGFAERRRTPMAPGVFWLEVAPHGHRVASCSTPRR